MKYLLIVFMTNVHAELRGRAADAGDNAAARVVVVDHPVEDVLIVVRVDAGSVVGIKVPRLAICEMVVGVRTGEAKRREQGRKNVEDDKHSRINQQVHQNACPNEINLEKQK